MQFVCPSEGAANLASRGAAKPNVSPLSRVGEHRRHFYKMCEKSDFQYDRDSDKFTLGHHLFHDHKLNCKTDFNDSYRV